MGTEFFRSSASRQFLSDWKKEEAKATEQRQKQEMEVERVKRILVVALDLCERNSGTTSSRTEHGSQLWFNVLDRLINAKGFLRLSKEQPAHAKVMAGVLSRLLQLTMQRMVSSVPLPDLVRKVTTDHSGSRLGELREMVESLLNTYGFELDVFAGAANVMHEDVKRMEEEYRRLKVIRPCCFVLASASRSLTFYFVCSWRDLLSLALCESHSPKRPREALGRRKGAFSSWEIGAMRASSTVVARSKPPYLLVVWAVRCIDCALDELFVMKPCRIKPLGNELTSDST
jgi:hypothetical protein